MKSKPNHLLFFSLFLLIPFFLDFSLIHSTQNSEKNHPPNKAIKSLVSKMIFIEGDTFITGRMSSIRIRLTPSDSMLFFPGTPRHTILDPFYISATEVTNSEWRAFSLGKELELGKSEGKRKYRPDTSLWISEFPYSYNKPHATNYFSNPKFNDYPVVGITWDQANEFCNWKSKKLNALLKKKGIKHSMEFRLPTEAEWELAANKKQGESKYSDQSIYIWSEEKGISQINKLTNIGQIKNINNIVFKQYADDGALYTSQVASYPANDKGVFDMAGNVSEWTRDQGYHWSTGSKNKKSKRLTSLSDQDFENEIESLKNSLKLKGQKVNPYVERLRHNKKILSPNDTKICKGGSWANGLVYTQIGSRQGVRKNNASTKIGFRIVISNVDETVLKYFPKKNWTP